MIMIEWPYPNVINVGHCSVSLAGGPIGSYGHLVEQVCNYNEYRVPLYKYMCMHAYEKTNAKTNL